MKYFAHILIYGVFSLHFIPPLFADGGIFDVTYLNENGKVEHGLYFDNVYFLILFFWMSLFLGLIPIVCKKIIDSIHAKISLILCAVSTVAFMFEILNLTVPEIVLNSSSNALVFSKVLLITMLSIASIHLFNRWKITTKY